MMGMGTGVSLPQFMFFYVLLSLLVEFVVARTTIRPLHNRGHVLPKRKRTNVHCQHKF